MSTLRHVACAATIAQCYILVILTVYTLHSVLLADRRQPEVILSVIQIR